MEDTIVAFTVRLPKSLIDQIEVRAAINHRKRNGEIHALLENAIDGSVGSDIQVRKQMSGLK